MNNVIDLQEYLDKKSAAIELIRQQEKIEHHINKTLSDFLHELHSVMNYYDSMEFINEEDLEKIIVMALRQRRDGIKIP